MDSEDEPVELGAVPTHLHPAASCLRSVYHADNHDTLGFDIISLLVELSRVELSRAAEPAPLRPARRGLLFRLFHVRRH